MKKISLTRSAALLSMLLITSHFTSQIIIPINSNLNSIDKPWVVNDILDSIINKVSLNKGGIICVNDKFVSIDTVTLGKIKNIESDSITLGRFLKKNQKKISSKEFWGSANTLGEHSRFYNGEMYIVWETPSPYIYRTNDSWRTDYYFSETLLSPISLLSANNIETALLDDKSKEVLKNFLQENNSAVAIRKDNNNQAIVNASVNILSILFQIMLVSGGGHGGSHSHNNSDHPVKTETGRRR